jgi:hypothetical protein
MVLKINAVYISAISEVVEMHIPLLHFVTDANPLTIFYTSHGTLINVIRMITPKHRNIDISQPLFSANVGGGQKRHCKAD